MKETINNAKEKMNKSLNALANEFAAIRAGRANPAVLDKVQVDYWGTPTPINQMAAISVSEGRILVISPWEKNQLKPIEKAIQASDLPEAFRQRIEKQLGEESKVAIRSIRRDAIDKIKKMQKNSEITEDDLKDAEKKVQDITDKFCAEADKAVADKEKEIMTV